MESIVTLEDAKRLSGVQSHWLGVEPDALDSRLRGSDVEDLNHPHLCGYDARN